MATTVNLGGSIKRKITNPDLIEEREKRTFDRQELENLLVEDHIRLFANKVQNLFKELPELLAGFE
jgi:hypothetical protein